MTMLKSAKEWDTANLATTAGSQTSAFRETMPALTTEDKGRRSMIVTCRSTKDAQVEAGAETATDIGAGEKNTKIIPRDARDRGLASPHNDDGPQAETGPIVARATENEEDIEGIAADHPITAVTTGEETTMNRAADKGLYLLSLSLTHTHTHTHTQTSIHSDGVQDTLFTRKLLTTTLPRISATAFYFP